MMKRTVMLVLFVFSMPAFAAEKAEGTPDKNDSASQPAVLSWLDMQRSGAQASSVRQTLTPVIQERVVKRYLDSFNAPIPVFFVDESVVAPTNAIGR